MFNNAPFMRVMWSALKWLAGLLGVLCVVLLPFGGPLVLLYYWFYVLVYIVPVGLLTGALMGLRTVKQTASTGKKKKAPERLSRTSKGGLALFFVILIGWLAFPYVTLNQIRFVDVSADWHIVDPADFEQEMYDACDSSLVLLIPDTHNQYELVCDQILVDYLESMNPERVRISYRVSYNFGNPVSHSLQKAGPVGIDALTSKWVGQWTGCGDVYEHSCDDPQIQDADTIIGGMKLRTVDQS